MSSTAKKLFGNASALLALQISSYILPFLLIPYLTRVFGTELYGVIAFGISTTQIACILTDFGFGLSATYKIAKNREDPLAIQKVSSSVFACKSALFIISIMLIWGIIETQEPYKEYESFFWLLLLPIAGQTLQPIWYFQGIERMGFITAYTILSRFSYILLVLALVKDPEDLYLIAISYGISQILAALLGIGLMVKLGYRFKWPGFYASWSTLKESAEFFWSRAAVAAYTVGGTFFLGITSSPGQVAYYSAAEQMYRGAQALFQPISQALYPYMARSRDIKIFKKILISTILISLISAGIGFLVGEQVILFIFGTGFSEATPILNIFIVTLLIATPSILLGYPLLGALGDSRSANMSVLYAGLLQILMLTGIYIALPKEGAYVASCILISELFVLIYRAIKSKELLRLQAWKKQSAS